MKYFVPKKNHMNSLHLTPIQNNENYSFKQNKDNRIRSFNVD